MSHQRPSLAIVGMSCRLPGNVKNPGTYWDLLINGRSGISEVPSDRWDWRKYYHQNHEVPGRMVTKWGGFIEDHDQFDAHFFGISPREAQQMDPQQRWLLESTWQAFEDAGIAPRTLRGEQVGVFVGISSRDYTDAQRGDIELIDIHTASGSALSIAANRISYFFDFKGPSIAVDTACSSALVATYLACQSIWSGECRVSLVGGVNALYNPNLSVGFSKASMLSPSGQCFAFDHRANGYVRGEGAGVVIIKPLDQALVDGDRIYALIRAAEVNQDGYTSSLTVPSLEAQKVMLRDACHSANIEPQQVSYVEAHGTGTPVGDPIEAQALGQVLGAHRSEACLIGSVKTNIGHLEAASGIAGLIKGALVLHHNFIPPQLNFEAANPNISLVELGLKVVTKGQPLPHCDDQPAIVGVNSFGFGGTNAHIILEQAPKPKPHQTKSNVPKANCRYVLPISGRTEAALQAQVEAYQTFLSSQSDALGEVAASAGNRREHLDQRLVVMGQDADELGSSLRRYLNGMLDTPALVIGQPASKPANPVFVFTGQGAQWWGMGQHLLECEPLFRQTIEQIDGLLKPLTNWSLLTEMARPQPESQIDRTDIAQPAIFALQVALSELWASWGIRPAKVMGHSVGEVAAAYVAGIYTLEDAVKIIYHRSCLQHSTAGQGSMVAVSLSMAEALQAINGSQGDVQVAANNSPHLVTLTGATDSVMAIAAEMEAAGKFVHRLPIDYAFHSSQMEPIRDDLLAALADIEPRAGHTPLVSTVTGEEISGQSMDAGYWWNNVRQSVSFAPAMFHLIQAEHNTFLEIGPHPALQHSIRDCLAEQNQTGHIFHSLRRDTDESLEMLRNLAALHIYGLEIKWQAVNQSSGRFVNLPGYSWQRQTFRLESEAKRREDLTPFEHPLLGMRLSTPNPTWQRQLDPRVVDYLEDHRIWNSFVFPAAGFGEMGLAVARVLFPTEPYAVENLQIKKALFMSLANVPTVQVVFDESDKTFTIYSASGQKKEWQLNALGQLRKLPPRQLKAVNIPDIQNELSFFADKTAYYQAYQSMGYQFGPNFQQIKNIWGKSGQALAEIEATELVCDQLADYHFHPTLLDACFQAVTAAGAIAKETKGEEVPYLPAAFGRIQLFDDHLPSRLWVKAAITAYDQQAITANFQVYDHQGQPLAEIKDGRFDRVKQKTDSLAETANYFYQFRWEPKRLKGAGVRGSAEFANITEMIAAMEAANPTIREEYDLGAFYQTFIPLFETTTWRIFQNCLLELGWDVPIGSEFSLDKVMLNLGIKERYRPLIHAELIALEQAGLLQVTEHHTWQLLQPLVPLNRATNVSTILEALCETYPPAAPDVALMQTVAPMLVDILRGNLDPLAVLFADGSSELLTTFYRDGVDQAASYRLMQAAVVSAIKNLPSHRPLRVLELGAGTGALTEIILPILPPDQTEYTFTDVSHKFLNEARQKFVAYSFIEYQIFDLAKEPFSQGLNPHGYDLVVAANVIHTTPDKKQTLDHIAHCLASNGLLLFLEFTDRHIAYDTIFGLFEEWWRYDDLNNRFECALLDQPGWEQLLIDSDFRDVTGFNNAPTSDKEGALSILVAMAPKFEETTSSEIVSCKATCLLFADRQGVATALAEALTQTGVQVLTVTPGASFHTHDDNTYAVDPTSETDLSRLLAVARSDDHAPLTDIVHAWGLDAPAADELSGETLVAVQNSTVLHALRLAQALASEKFNRSLQITFLGRGIQAVIDGDSCNAMALAPLVGFLRVANNEFSAFKWRLIDLAPVQSEFEIDDLAQELTLADDEVEIAYRQNRRYVNRLRQAKIDDLAVLRCNAIQADGSILPYRLQFDKSGSLTNLSLNETTRRPPDPDEIEVQVQAGGLNFRDVMKVLGLYPGHPVDLTWLGDDFAGIVIAVGDQVTDLNPGDAVVGLAPHAFRSYLTVNAQTVLKKPDHLSFEEAATLPTVFLTAYYALVHLAKLQPGERVLIHAGAGGVGQAAIQIAQDLELEIFATAGTPEKRALLREQGVPHVFDSRSLNFADDIMRVTHGRGVDAVLNSLAGDFIAKNFSALAPFGRYLEIGKVDVYSNSKIGLEPLRNNISVFVIDLAQLMEHRPADFVAILEALRLKFEQNIYRPLPHTVFSITQAEEAFRYMAAGKHIGKNVLSFQADEIPVGRITEAGKLFRTEASYLISGGAGGFGLEVAKWMADQGARHLVLMTRSGPADEAAKADIEQLQADGVDVLDVRGDVTRPADVERIVQEIQRSSAPLAGVVHSAMVLDDQFIIDLDETSFNRVLWPKLLGAWNLHQATRHIPLEHFICFSSMVSIIGNLKQSNYSAGNTFLDILAHCRRAMGLPALTINWGALSGAGFVARNQEVGQYLANVGLKSFSAAQALQMLGDILPLDGVQLGVASIDWNELSKYLPSIAHSNVFDHLTRQETAGLTDGSIIAHIVAASPSDRLPLVEKFLSQTVADVLNTDLAQIDPNTSLPQLGLDSLMSIELINSMNAQLNLNLAVSDVLGRTTIYEIALILLEKILATAIVSDQVDIEQPPESEPDVWPGLLDQNDAQVDLLAEAQLDPSIYPDVTAQPVVTPPQSIFLTGATGFLGAFLLADLLRQTEADIYCLVRAKNEQTALQRLRDNLARYDLRDDRQQTRLKPVVGDLTRSHLGLSTEQFQELATQIDVIYHNGAALNLIQPYHVLKATNVSSVQEILRLAGQTKIKPVHYVSTIAVFFAAGRNRQTVIYETDWPDHRELRGGYMQSKWVAEQLIQQAQNRGVPCIIYRPGIITGHSQTGVTNTQDLASRLVKGSYQLGLYPDRNQEVNIVPVDYVSRAITYLSQQPETAGQVFHLTNLRSTQLNDIVRWAGLVGDALQEVSYREWRAALIKQMEQGIENELLPLLAFFSSDRPEQVEQQVDCQNTLRYLANTDIVCPPIDRNLIEVYADYLITADFLETSQPSDSETI